MYYQLLNIIVFLVLCVLSLKYIASQRELIKHPFLKGQKMPVTGTQAFFLFAMATGILALGSLMVARLLATIILCLIAIISSKNKFEFVRNPVVIAYFFYLLWLIFAIYYSPVKVYGIRVFAKYLCPLLMLILGSQVASSYLFTHKVLKIILFVGILGSIHMIVRIPFISPLLWSMLWWGPAILDFLPVAICIALAFATLLKKQKYLWFIPLFILASLLNTNRTGLLVASISIAFFSIVRYKIRSFPYVFLGIAILVGAVLYVPSVRDKMFRKKMTTEDIIENRDELTTDDIDSNGRFAMWEWSLDHFYKDKELTGSGLGVLQARFYSQDHPFGSIRICHNDYVQILCDTGLIGLVLYASIFILLFLHTMVVAWLPSTPIPVKVLAMIAGPALAGIAASLYTDNAVNYSLMTLNYPFAIYGIFLGLEKRMRGRG